jgi:hypothetical protein
MKWVVGRAVRITIAPGTEWLAILQEVPYWGRSLASFVLPLALIPAASWCIGLLLSSKEPTAQFTWILHRGAIVYLSAVLSVSLLAVSLYVVAPVFGGVRSWGRALQVAAYSSAPVLIGGFLLVIPDMVFAMLLAAFHGFYLQYVGVQHLLRVAENRAAEFVAIEIVAFIVLSTLLGTFFSWLGVV